MSDEMDAVAGTFADNAAVDVRMQGLEVQTCPMAKQISSMRIVMEASNCGQFMCLHGHEPARLMTGTDQIIGDYEWNTAKTREAFEILAVIPKYQVGIGSFPIRKNPRLTVVYLGETTGEVGYFHISAYSKPSEGFGYLNNWVNTQLLHEGNYVQAGTKFYHSPIHMGETHNTGVNLNVCYLSHPSVNKDAIPISRSAAARMNSTGIKTVRLTIKPSEIAKNLYGSELESKFFPDIDEQVNNTGILCCFDNPTATTFISSMSQEAMHTPQVMHDKIIVAPPGATILDVDVYCSPDADKLVTGNIYNQIIKYRDGINRYRSRIIDVYRDAVRRGCKIGHAFNTLVTDCMAMLTTEPGVGNKPTKRNMVTLTYKKDVIDFVHLEITYAFDNVTTKGYKLTGRDGNKGVCDIWEDEDMPVDEHGIKADMIIDFTSPPNRMNTGQLVEAFISRKNLFVVDRIKALYSGVMPADLDTTEEGLEHITPTPQGAWDYFISYYTDVNPNQTRVLLRDVITSENAKWKFLDEVMKYGIYNYIISYAAHISMDWVQFMEKKYPSPKSRITFNVTDRHGKKRSVTTEDPVLIGSKYIWCLCKIPHVKACGIAYVSLHRAPVAPSTSKRLNYHISQTPIRCGEDETRNFAMASGSPTAARVLGLHANNPDAVRLLTKTLLTDDYPTRVKRINMTTEEIIRGNTVVAMTKHLFGTVGRDISAITSPEEAETFKQQYLTMTKR